jgi:DNA-binding MltR family transcriptional regulator
MLDHELRKALLTKMRSLSLKKEERIFDGFGPLGEFAAKIELAYALNLLSDPIYGDLRIIKKIRDHFAHSTEETTFFKGKPRDFIREFAFKAKATYPMIFAHKVDACLSHIRSQRPTKA